ncbi:fic family toxin-antitoxin system, toxin component [Streptacidiphilus sp. EB103A]|uniref:fic family toxin-antitoxin system, toxin component n=1 Tax=Streptacidiphilus sp. EB103A TaxID=3156275 RepID=UPI00351475CF
MQLSIDRAWLLELAREQIPGDPDVLDWGATAAAVARHCDEVLGTPVYAKAHQRAAALLQTLVRVPALEHSNELFAATAAAAFLNACGLRVSVTTKEAVDLVERTASGEFDVRQVAAALKTWIDVSH